MVINFAYELDKPYPKYIKTGTIDQKCLHTAQAKVSE